MTKGHADHVRYKGPDYVPWNVTDPLGRPWSADYDPWDGLTTVVLFGSLFVAVILCIVLKSLWRQLYTKYLRACFIRIGLMKWYWWLADKETFGELVNGSEQIVVTECLTGNTHGEIAILHSRQDRDSLAMHSLDFSSNDSVFLERADSCLLGEVSRTDVHERISSLEANASNCCSSSTAPNHVTVIEIDECVSSSPEGESIIPAQT